MRKIPLRSPVCHTGRKIFFSTVFPRSWHTQYANPRPAVCLLMPYQERYAPICPLRPDKYLCIIGLPPGPYGKTMTRSHNLSGRPALMILHDKFLPFPAGSSYAPPASAAAKAPFPSSPRGIASVPRLKAFLAVFIS